MPLEKRPQCTSIVDLPFRTYAFGKTSAVYKYSGLTSDVRLGASQQPFPDEEHINPEDVHQLLKADRQAA